MPLTAAQTLGMILAVAAATMLTRFLPFEVFRKEPPRWTQQIGQILPPAMMGFLVVYCLKNAEVVAAPHALPELIAIAVIVLLHTWRHNVLLSIAAGTLVYVVLIRVM